MTAIHNGDCAEVIASKIPAQSVNLIVTSPPYADQRSGNYGGIHPDKYMEWFLLKTAAFKHCLAPDGSFVLNIKEKAIAGEKHPLRLRSRFGNAPPARMAIGRRVLLAQKELLPRKVAEPIPGFMGASISLFAKS